MKSVSDLFYLAGAELAERRFTLSQQADCCAPGDAPNTVEISTANVGGGAYLVLKVARWAFDNKAEIDDFARLLKRHLPEKEKTKESKDENAI